MNSDFSNAFRWPLQSAEVRQSLLDTFESGQWGKYDGKQCRALNEALAAMLDLDFVRLCSSGTVAVEIALAGLGIRSGDEVILAGYDFPGNFRAIEHLGAVPVLADIDPTTWSLDADSLEGAISKKTRAIIVSHLHGGIAAIENIRSIAQGRGIRLVEDICQCPGAKWMDRPLGSFGDICAMSFGGSKLLSAGRGGAIATDDESIWQRAKIYCDRGNDAFPLSELQAAVLMPQISQLGPLAEKRRSSVGFLMDKLNSAGCFGTIGHTTGSQPDFYKVPILLSQDDRKQESIDKLRAKGIVIDHGFAGFTTRSQRRCRKPVELAHSKKASQNTLVLHHPCLLSDKFEQIVDEIIHEVTERH